MLHGCITNKLTVKSQIHNNPTYFYCQPDRIYERHKVQHREIHIFTEKIVPKGVSEEIQVFQATQTRNIWFVV